MAIPVEISGLSVGPSRCRLALAGRRISFVAPTVLVLLLCMLGAWRVHAAEVMIDGVAWRQLTDTAGAGLSWDDVASVCPLDEIPCQGSVNGVDFTGWTWASRARVEALVTSLTGFAIPVNEFDPSPSLVIFDYFAPVATSASGTNFLTAALWAAPAVSGQVEVLWMQDALVNNSHADKIEVQLIGSGDTELDVPPFGLQPLAVFLVRDPDLELCGNGLDDDANGLVDGDDPVCATNYPVIEGREWRQVTETAGLNFWEMGAACPGAACDGVVGGVNVSGWTWANAVEVADMINSLVDDLGIGIEIALGENEIFNYPTLLNPVFAKFTPTQVAPQAELLAGVAYNSSGEKGSQSNFPNPQAWDNPQTCTNGLDDDADGDIDFADLDCGWVRFFKLVNFFDPGSNDFWGMLGSSFSGTPPDFGIPPWQGGYFLYREPVYLSLEEVCDNTFDDDGDGLVDAADDDCATVVPPVGLLVRCIHEPLWPEVDEQVTVHAEAIDARGNPVEAELLEVYRAGQDVAEGSVTDAMELLHFTTPSGQRMSYACRAERGSETAFSGWREVDVGSPELSDIRAVPVIYNGPMDKKIDLVFIPEFSRHGVGVGGHERFLSDIFQILRGGLYGVPWFVRHQQDFNIWLGRDPGRVTPNDPDDSSAWCDRDKPDGYSRKYGFADAVGIIHTSDCRDKSSLGFYSTELDVTLLQVVAHEIGHAAFSLSDEYVGSTTLHFTLPDFPNLFLYEFSCRSAAQERGFDPNQCRALVHENGSVGISLGGNWIFEPDYRTTVPRTPDLMQQTGSRACGSDTCGQYDVGPSETHRMQWKLNKCHAGRC